MLIYLSAPYSNPPQCVRWDRERSIAEVARSYICCGHCVFSPISHGIGIEYFSAGCTYDDWMRVDLEILPRCDVLVVLKLEGWQESKGMAQEIETAGSCGMSYYYVTYDQAMAGELFPASRIECPDCEGYGMCEYTYSEAGINPGGSNDHALNMAGAVAGCRECEKCGGSGTIVVDEL